MKGESKILSVVVLLDVLHHQDMLVMQYIYPALRNGRVCMVSTVVVATVVLSKSQLLAV